MKLTLGFSPCPNDCFIFDAIVHRRIDLEGLDFEVELHDVETLNRKAMKAGLDVTKLSFHAYGYVLKSYILLRAGSALGFNCGPLLVAKQPVADLNRLRSVAIPGRLTTANFLLSLALPQLSDRREFVFSEIEDAVLEGKVDAGLIIHENRFTYEQKGLHKLLDLGEYWESLIHAPIPLGGIVARRTIENDLLQKLNRVIRRSVEFAFAHPEASSAFVKRHAQAMDEQVRQQHINLYVNQFTVDLGTQGKEAVELMFRKAAETGVFRPYEAPLIID